MTKIIHFPAEQTREAIVDRAIAHAEKVLRLARTHHLVIAGESVPVAHGVQKFG